MSLRYLSRDGLGLTSLLHFFNYYFVNNRKLSGYFLNHFIFTF